MKISILDLWLIVLGVASYEVLAGAMGWTTNGSNNVISAAALALMATGAAMLKSDSLTRRAQTKKAAAP